MIATPWKIRVLHGPNLNLVGRRDPAQYGRVDFARIVADLDALAPTLGVQLDQLQSNHEGVLIDAVQAAMDDGTQGLVVNAGGLTHSSVSLRDALAACALPFIEVHLSNIHAREPFRRVSLLSELARGQIAGLGAVGYSLALRGLVQILDDASRG